MMKGTVKAYSSVVSAGVIEGSDGKSYNFSLEEWRGEKLPEYKDSVIFHGHSRNATKVSSQA